MFRGLKKEEIKILSNTKYEDAVILFDNKRYSNSYYLAGYSVEFAIKACIASRIEADTIPDLSLIKGIYSHDFAQLIGIAGLTQELRQKQNHDPDFHSNWGIVTKWNEAKRYDVADRSTTQYFLDAIGNNDHGVLKWIKTYW